MSYMIVEKQGFAEYAIIVMDGYGQNKVFGDRKAAEEEVADCQYGIVIEL